MWVTGLEPYLLLFFFLVRLLFFSTIAFFPAACEPKPVRVSMGLPIGVSCGCLRFRTNQCQKREGQLYRMVEGKGSKTRIARKEKPMTVLGRLFGSNGSGTRPGSLLTRLVLAPAGATALPVSPEGRLKHFKFGW